MKRKYYLRGIGVGILFATIVLWIAYIAVGSGQMSDAEIIERAKELGMVQAESVLDSLDKPADKANSEDNQKEDAEADTGTGEPGVPEEGSDDTGEEQTEGSSEASSAASEAGTEEPTTDARIVTFTVVSGMSSWNVATILQDQGVVESASEFDAYLEENGYSERIATGEYSVAIGTDYEVIAKMITGQ